jgi:CRISPR-associated Cas5-like protein
MIAIEFRLKISSMYSIRVPYSYQCARTYPLPAPSTIKGLCANALWRKQNCESPVKLLEEIQKNSLGATSRTEQNIAVSSCTVSIVDLSKKEGKKTNALLRQFAFTPYIDCMIAFKDGSEKLAVQITEALKFAPVYLGDSESLVCVVPESISIIGSKENIKAINEGDNVEINSLFKFEFVKENYISEKGVILYMQEDPCSAEALLERFIAPIKQNGDFYSPIESFSIIASKDCFIIEGKILKGLFCETHQKEPTKEKTKRTRKKKE